MATTLSARRRQRPPRRTTSATAHARANHVVGARQNRASATGAVAPTPTPNVAAVEPPVKAVRPMRSPDSDDHLAAYFRQLAAHDLLSPEDERELSQGIEDTEILTWERVLSRADVVRPLIALLEPNLEQPVKFPKLDKVLDEMLKSKRARKDDEAGQEARGRGARSRDPPAHARSRSRPHRCRGPRARPRARDGGDRR